MLSMYLVKHSILGNPLVSLLLLGKHALLDCVRDLIFGLRTLMFFKQDTLVFFFSGPSTN